MKTLSAQMTAHIAGEVTSLCRCWVVETTSGKRLGFTDHDNDIELDGVKCERNAGVEASGIEEHLGMNVDSSDVSGALQSNCILGHDIDAGIYDNALVKTYLVNWNDVQDYFLDRVNRVGEITQKDGHYLMELRGLSSSYDQTKGNHFVSRCQAILGDEKCKFALTGSQYVADGTVDEARSSIVLKVSGLASYDDGWFQNGYLTWQSGSNDTLKIEVMEHLVVNNEVIIHLWQPMPHEIKQGDTFELKVGCDKSFSTCKEKFSNQLNFRGFPHIPGNSAVLSYAPNTDKFDGGPIVL